MFRFEDPIYLWLLLAIPLLMMIRFVGYRQRRRKFRKLGDADLLRQLMPDVSKYRPTVKFFLLLSALALLIVLLARPQMGSKITNEKRNGIETIICLDISNSMLAEDVAPSRLEKSKLLVENLVDHFTNDKIGLIVFAGDAFVQLPITSDYVSAKMFLQSINPSMIAVQGTDIAHAVKLAMNSFTQQEKIGRAIILITDGEDHEGGALEAAQEAKKKGINVFILGVGDPKGAPIPLGNGDYLTDAAGQTVMTALNEDMCRQVAQAGSGTYIHVDNTSTAQEKLNDELTRLQKGETDAVLYSEYDDQFQAFGIIVLLLLVIEVCLLKVRNPLLKNISLFRRKPGAAAVILLFLLLPLAAQAQADRQSIRSGNKLYRQQVFDKAEVEYRKAEAANPRNPQAMYNLGCALMSQQKDSAAIVQFEHAGKMETSPKRKAMIYHNIGWICQKHQMFGEAIEAYKESLRNNPDDNETRYNLALCKRQQKNQQQNGGGQNNQDKDKQQQQQKDQQQQQQQKDQEQKQQQQQQQPKDQMSRENAEQLLNAAMQEEKQTQQRMKDAQRRQSRRKLDKNW
ncbi:MAG: VWA domain-containing protein [Prevotella sp.]|nr:VWA domain-containing protein [Prevotella sp.]